MNVYARYFDDEIIATSFEQLMDFICAIDGIRMTEVMRNDIADYVEGRFSYAKRFKVNNRSYFILIKTPAATLQEFKDNAGKDMNGKEDLEREKELLAQRLCEVRVGWYEAMVSFKRVVPQVETGKFQYVNTDFKAKVKATSIQDCYDRVMRYLRGRTDIDERSQYPSIKGRNFQAQYLGM